MFSIGIDVGSSGVKGIALHENKIIASFKREMLAPSSDAIQKTMDELVAISGNPRRDFAVVITGMGMHRVETGGRKSSEILCLAKGSKWHCNKASTIIDLGAETIKVINLSPAGKVLEYAKNEKCAAGTSMVFRILSNILGIPVSEMDQFAPPPGNTIRISTVCSVFMETEIISYLARGISREEILGGVYAAIADQIMALLARIQVEPGLVLTGGAARNRIISSLLADRIGLPVQVPPEPEMVAALGAALAAQELIGGRP